MPLDPSCPDRLLLNTVDVVLDGIICITQSIWFLS